MVPPRAPSFPPTPCGQFSGSRRAKPGSAHGTAAPVQRMTARVVVYHAEGCGLCERARRQLAALREELGFELEEVDIGGDEALEARYREWLPVVEIDGEQAFVYFVDEAAFRRRLGRD
jgi:glutaredoxin